MKFFATLILALPALALATPSLKRTDSGDCSTGPLQCCQSQVSSNSVEGKALLGLSGLTGHPAVSDGGPVSISCSPILPIIPIGGSTCTADPVCCQTGNGFISIGCIGVGINL